jgi:hypothetical protein
MRYKYIGNLLFLNLTIFTASDAESTMYRLLSSSLHFCVIHVSSCVTNTSTKYYFIIFTATDEKLYLQQKVQSTHCKASHYAILAIILIPFLDPITARNRENLLGASKQKAVFLGTHYPLTEWLCIACFKTECRVAIFRSECIKISLFWILQ